MLSSYGEETQKKVMRWYIGESLSTVTINNQQRSTVSALRKNNIIICVNKNYTLLYAGVHGMVDRSVLEADGESRVGSSPIARTMMNF